MTLKELSQLYHLTQEIKADQRRLEELTALVGAPATAQLTGMPHAPHENSSKVERQVAEIVDLQAIIAARQIQCIHERARLERWISEIPDSFTRRVFMYRFVDKLTWPQVAAQIGGGNSESAVKMVCHRYLKAYNERGETHEID